MRLSDAKQVLEIFCEALLFLFVILHINPTSLDVAMPFVVFLVCLFFGLQYFNYDKHHPFPVLRPFAKKLALILFAFIGFAIGIAAVLMQAGAPLAFIASSAACTSLCTVLVFVMAVFINTRGAQLQQRAPLAFKASILLLLVLLLLTSFCTACQITLIPNIANALAFSSIGFIESLRIQLMVLCAILPTVQTSLFFMSFSAWMGFSDPATSYNPPGPFHLQATFSKISLLSAILIIGRTLIACIMPLPIAQTTSLWLGRIADIASQSFSIALRFFSFSFSLPYIERELFPLTFPVQSQAAFVAPPPPHNPGHSPSPHTFSVQSEAAFAAPQPPDAPNGDVPSLNASHLFQASKTPIPSTTLYYSTC